MEKLNTKVNRKALYTSLFVYCFLLVWVIIFKCCSPDVLLNEKSKQFITAWWTYEERFLNGLQPLNTVTKGVWIQTIPNMLMFLPLGFYLPLLLKKQNAFRDIALVLLISIFLEVVQLLDRLGIFDWFDILFNTIGGIVGVGLFKLFIKKLQVDNFTKLINVCNIMIAVIGVPLALGLTIYTGINHSYYDYYFTKQ